MSTTTTDTAATQISAEVAKTVMEAFNQRDFDTMLAHLHADYEAVWPHATLAGLDAVAHETTILEAFPNLQMEIQGVSSTGTGALVELIVTGTNTGPLVMAWGTSYEPSGRELRLPMAIVMELDGDVIRRERLYFDQRTILQQCGHAHDAQDVGPQ